MTNIDMFVMSMKADKRSQATIDTYVPTIKEMLEIVGKAEKDIKYLDLKMWQAQISNVSSATVSRKITTVRSYFNFLFDSELIDTNPALKLRAPHIVNQEKDYVPYDEATKMIECGKNPRDKAIIAMYLSTGLRVTELCSITLEQYLNNNINIKVKGNKFRKVYLNDDCKKYIDAYLSVRKSGCEYLFVSNQHTQMSRVALNRTVKVLAERANIDKNISNHTFRHSFCSDMCDKYGIAVAQKVIGHSSPNITARYCHNEQSQIESIMTGIKL